MNDISVLYLLLIAQAAQWGLLLRHLLQCRDVRRDIDLIKLRIGIRSLDDDK